MSSRCQRFPLPVTTVFQAPLGKMLQPRVLPSRGNGHLRESIGHTHLPHLSERMLFGWTTTEIKNGLQVPLQHVSRRILDDGIWYCRRGVEDGHEMKMWRPGSDTSTPFRVGLRGIANSACDLLKFGISMEDSRGYAEVVKAVSS